MKLFHTTLAALALISTLFAGSSALAQAPNEAQCSVLYAAQTTEVGAVCVTINEDTVLLDYLLIGDWKLNEAHAWIGDNLALLPVNGSGGGLVAVPVDGDAKWGTTISAQLSQHVVGDGDRCVIP